MDVIYPVRPGTRNEELRYSLRSLANLSQAGRVIVSGFCPQWLKPDDYIPIEQRGNKQANAKHNLYVALLLAATEHVILMNDDFYIMQPVARIPRLHMGLVTDRLTHRFRDHPYHVAMRATHALMVGMGIAQPLNYELHVPMVFDRRRLLRVLELGAHIPGVHYRSLYGNLYRIGGKQVVDCKVYTVRDKGFEDWPFLSTSDNLHEPAGRFVVSRFPDPSPYEVPHPGVRG